MANKTITASLSRAHKYVERLTREADKRANALVAAGSPVTVPVYAEHVRAVRRHEEWVKTKAELTKVRAGLSAVRLAIAAKNSEVGLHNKLAEHALLVRELRDLTQVASAVDSEGAIQLENLEAYFLANQNSGPFHHAQQPRLAVLSEREITELEAEKTLLNARIDAVLDEINDLNASNRVQFELDEDIAALIGL